MLSVPAMTLLMNTGRILGGTKNFYAILCSLLSIEPPNKMVAPLHLLHYFSTVETKKSASIA